MFEDKALYPILVISGLIVATTIVFLSLAAAIARTQAF